MSATILLILRLALTATLYIFLGFALWILWQDLRRYSRAPASRLAPPLILRAVPLPAAALSAEKNTDGKAAFSTTEMVSTDAAPSAAQEHRFTSSEVFIGRDPASEFRLEDKTISARHARLMYHHGQWWVEDLKSRNGTSLNGVPVSTAVVLTSGDQLQCGACIFLVILGNEAQLES